MDRIEQGGREQVRAEGLFAAWAARIDEGAALDFESLVRAHPDVEGELRKLHDDWQLFAPILGRAVPGLVASDSGVVIPSIARDPDAPEEGGDPATSAELYARLGIHAPGQGRYRFRSVIGRGGGGVVLKVWDTKLNRALAMKVVLGREEDRPDSSTPNVDGRTLSRFVDEARIASQLNHPGIVPVHELGADETGRAFFTMKLVKGEDLAHVLEKVASGTDGWNPTRVLTVLLRVCEAMAYAHDKGVIHRDLKPANVMVGAYGEVHVMDWGLARMLGEKDRRDVRIRPTHESKASGPRSAVVSFRQSERDATSDSPLMTMDGSVIGTPSYMSPEQARGELDAIGTRSDVYSVGAMLYHLLTREAPYVPSGTRVPQQTVLIALLHGGPKRVEELAPNAPVELVAICEKAMQRESTLRYGSMLELAADLRAYVEGKVVTAYETGTWADTKKWVVRNKGLTSSLAAAIALLVVGLTTSLVFKGRADERAADLQMANSKLKATTSDLQSANAQLEAATRDAQWKSYVAAIRGAQAARSANEPATVRRLLDDAPALLRNWEWRFLDARSNTSLLMLDGQHGSFSPDGTRIATVASNRIVRVWDGVSGSEIAELKGHAGWILSATFSPDGARIVTASTDATARVWDAVSGKDTVTLEGDFPFMRSASVSPDGVRIVTTSDDATARVWDAASGKQLAKLEGHTDTVDSARFSPDSTRIVTASQDNTVRVWNADDGQHIARMDSHAWVLDASFSPDGTRIVTASVDGTARVWDSVHGNALATLEGHASAVRSARFSPDGGSIATASDDGTARVWDAASGSLIAKLEGHASSVLSASFSLDGTGIVTASSDATARVWSAATGRELARLEGHLDEVHIAQFSPDGSRILTSSNDGTTRVWDVATVGDFTAIEGKKGGIESLSFSPDGTLIVAACSDASARLWDSASGDELTTLEGHTDRVVDACFSRDGARIATASWDGSARVWDVVSGSVIAKLEGHALSVVSVRFSSDGRRVVTASDDATACVWDAVSGGKITTLEGHTMRLFNALFNLDGSRIVTASYDGTVRVWDAAAGTPLATFAAHKTALVRSVCFSPDGTRIITGSEDARALVWDVDSRSVVAKLYVPTETFNIAGFSPDGTRIVTGARDGTTRVWDAVSGIELAKLEGHTDLVASISFSSDGMRIVTGSRDGTVRVWDTVSGIELAKLPMPTTNFVSASFSFDGTRIVTSSYGGTARVWDSVPYRVRYAERRALDAASPAAEIPLADALGRTSDWVESSEQLREDPAIDPLVRRAAIDRLTQRACKSRHAAADLHRRHLGRTWIRQMLGLDPWTNEAASEAAIALDSRLATDPGRLNATAWRLVDPEGVPGDAVRAFVLARRAVSVASKSSDDARLHTCAYRDTLARALFRLGRFDEALAEQRTALAEAPADEKAAYEDYLQRLESDIAAWRDESGNLRRTEWIATLESLEREIAALEADPDVQRWIDTHRRYPPR